MWRFKLKTFGVLNVVAHPHPEGIYERVFAAAGEMRRGAKFYGDRYATLSPVTGVRQGVFTGRLATWTEVDRNAKTIDTALLEERLFDESGVVIPSGTGLNSKVFNFAFNVDKHQLVLETRNDEDQTISIGLGQRAIAKVLAMVKIPGLEELSVHLVTREDAIARILSLPELRKISIDLFKPNPDDLSDVEREMLEELEALNAKRNKTELTKSKDADTLVLTPRYRAMAQVAKNNGSVAASGRDEDKEKINLNTKQLPKSYSIDASDDSGAIVARRLAQDLDAEGDGSVIE